MITDTIAPAAPHIAPYPPLDKLAVLQFYNIRISHILINITKRRKEDIWSRTTYEPGVSLIRAIYRYQTKIEEQTQEVIRVIDTLSRKILYEITHNITLGNQFLNDAGIMVEVLVMTNQHANLIVVNTLLLPHLPLTLHLHHRNHYLLLGAVAKG